MKHNQSNNLIILKQSKGHSALTGILLVLILLVFHEDLKAWDQSLEKNKTSIQGMTKTEREELLNKYRHFKKLTRDEKRNLRELHKATRKNNDLGEAKTVYSHWLRSLDPISRTELRNEKDLQKRIKLVKKILQEQKSQRNHRRPGKSDFPFNGRFPEDDRPKLSAEELESIFSIIESIIKITEEQRTKLNGMKPLEKQIAIMTFLLEKRRQPFEKKTVEKIIQTIKNEEITSNLEQIKRPELRTIMFSKLLAGSLFSQVQIIISEQNLSAEEEKEIFDQLDSSFQDRLLSMPEEERKKRLRMEYLKKKNRPLYENVRKLLSQVKKHPPGSQNRRRPFGRDRENKAFGPDKRTGNRKKDKSKP
jgi:hypothetical protein